MDCFKTTPDFVNGEITFMHPVDIHILPIITTSSCLHSSLSAKLHCLLDLRNPFFLLLDTVCCLSTPTSSLHSFVLVDQEHSFLIAVVHSNGDCHSLALTRAIPLRPSLVDRTGFGYHHRLFTLTTHNFPRLRQSQTQNIQLPILSLCATTSRQT